MDDIKRISYEKYQMHWMLTHNITMAQISDIAADWFNERFSNPNYDDKLREYLEEHGFDGNLWACYDEFFDGEYLDRSNMRCILSEEEFRKYLVDIGDGYVDYIEAIKLIDDCINQGILQESESLIPICRENGWFWEPKEYVARNLMYDKIGRVELSSALEKKRAMSACL